MTELLLAAALAGLAVGLLVWALWQQFNPARRQIMANLHRGRTVVVEGPDEAPAGSGGAGQMAVIARRLTPTPVRGMLEKQYLLGGRPVDWPVDRLLVLKAVWVPVAFVLMLLVLLSDTPPLLRGMVLVVSIVVYFLPELLLNSNGQKRNEAIELELADTLDQMMISVEAGLGFDAAMSMAAKNGKGPLADELKRTFQDIQIGRSRRQAFEALTERTTVPDLRRFVRAVVQADAYGISISDVLRTQASEMRLKRRQRAEEKAQKVPVKVLMPLMLCILPVLFIVVLGPAVMGMVEAFGNM